MHLATVCAHGDFIHNSTVQGGWASRAITHSHRPDVELTSPYTILVIQFQGTSVLVWVFNFHLLSALTSQGGGRIDM